MMSEHLRRSIYSPSPVGLHQTQSMELSTKSEAGMKEIRASEKVCGDGHGWSRSDSTLVVEISGG